MPVALGLLLWPLIEIALFVTVGGWLELWLTLAIVLGTAVAGIMLMRWRGVRAMADMRSRMRDMGNPLSLMADQAVFMLAGMLLILPGFLTDFLGLLLLVPPVRLALIALAARRVVLNPNNPMRQQPDRSHGDVIDGDFMQVGPDRDASRRPSGWTQD